MTYSTLANGLLWFALGGATFCLVLASWAGHVGRRDRGNRKLTHAEFRALMGEARLRKVAHPDKKGGVN